MNGKCAKRIRLASRFVRADRDLKAEYKALPYHRRPGVPNESHSAKLRHYHLHLELGR